MSKLIAPFPYFGGKARVSDVVWQRFGKVPNYVEPFFGSGAVLLGRPGFDAAHPFLETVNDSHAYVANFWRAMKEHPEELAEICDNPVNECDLEAWHKWLVEASRKMDLAAAIKADPYYCDVKVAGRWCWGICQWIAGGWCAGEWNPDSPADSYGPGINVKDPVRGGKMPDLHGKGRGRGALKKIPNLVNTGVGIFKQKPALGNYGQGVHRKRPDLERGKGVLGRGLIAKEGKHPCSAWFAVLSERFKLVRVCCGDWSRVLTKTPTTLHGLTAVFLDPPYSSDRSSCYAEDSYTVATDVQQWCMENGSNRQLRIALCGHSGEHEALENHGWSVFEWKTRGGYAATSKHTRRGRDNARRERIWFSPHCLAGKQAGLLF